MGVNIQLCGFLKSISLFFLFVNKIFFFKKSCPISFSVFQSVLILHLLFCSFSCLGTVSYSFSSFWGRLLDYWFNSFILSYHITSPPVSMTAVPYKFQYSLCSFQPSSSYFPVILKAFVLVNDFLLLYCLIYKHLVLGGMPFWHQSNWLYNSPKTHFHFKSEFFLWLEYGLLEEGH